VISIRDFAMGDIYRARNLLAQLGYVLDDREFTNRVSAVRSSKAHCLLVAENKGTVAGLVHVFERPALDKPLAAVVQALVVDIDQRGAGIGEALMHAAEEWARKRGYGSVALYSGVTRSDAHKFYARLGYELLATSNLMVKRL
jgi:predicted N-acetyltransferase YhbS